MFILLAKGLIVRPSRLMSCYRYQQMLLCWRSKLTTELSCLIWGVFSIILFVWVQFKLGFAKITVFTTTKGCHDVCF